MIIYYYDYYYRRYYYYRYHYLFPQIQGQSAFVNETSGEVFVIAEGGKIDGGSLQQVLKGFGDLRSFAQTGLLHKQVSPDLLFPSHPHDPSIPSGLS